MNDNKYQAALDAVNRMFSDTSVGHETTLSNLQGVRDEIDMMIDATKTAIRFEQKEKP